MVLGETICPVCVPPPRSLIIQANCKGNLKQKNTSGGGGGGDEGKPEMNYHPAISSQGK